MRITFKELESRARKVNAVLERESFGYSLYSNTHFVQDDCRNLREVQDSLELLEERAKINSFDCCI